MVLIIGCNKPEKVITSEIKAPYSNQPIVLTEKFSETKHYLHRLKQSDLRLLRNEIYARKGYVFKSEELLEYFSKYDWYEPKYSEIEIGKYLTTIDSFNIKVIQIAESKVAERERYYSYTFLDFLNVIPEIKLPAKCGFWEYKSDSTNKTSEAEAQRIIERFDYYSNPFGKITLNDSVYAIGINHASDVRNYTTFFIVNKIGDRLGANTVPSYYTSSEDLYDIEDTIPRQEIIEHYNESIITKDLYLITSSWDKVSRYDSLNNLVEEFTTDTIIEQEVFIKK